MSGGSSFNEIFLDKVRVPDTRRLGAIGEGWRVARTTLGLERGTGATKRVGAGWERVLGLARHIGVDDDPIARQHLARVYTSMQLLRYTNQRIAASVRAGQSPGPEASILKLAWVEQLQLVSATATHLLGLRLIADTGEWGTYSWSEHVTGTPGYRIAGGADEIQRNIIGERVLGLPIEPFHQS
jgi:alkylation response protein AidB-like acyl-CoA dehydrogenase